MYFTPAIGTGGYLGWRILENTAANQKEAFEQSPNLIRNIEYFKENIGNARTAKDLVNDRRLLTVALGAFGLGDEINKKAFVLRMLEDGTDDTTSFANRINDQRYKDFVEAFGYGNIDNGANILLESFHNDIIARYKTMEFESAVGDVDNDMRLAMNFKREIAALAEEDGSDSSFWFKIMGSQPLREVISTAFNLPTSISQLDIDKQQEIFAEKADRMLGSSSPEAFSDTENINTVIRRFFLTRQIESGPTSSTPGFAALSLLQGSGLGEDSSANLLLSQIY